MSISLDKKIGINLTKGATISLEKDGKTLDQVCIGLNWGAIQKKSFFGLISNNEGVDLDGSVTCFTGAKKEIDTVYFGNLVSKDAAIRHSGDDLSGDTNGDDGKDNEIIEINLTRIAPNVEQIVFFLNSYKGQDFKTIPYSKIRIFQGNKNQVQEVLTTFNLSAEDKFAGAVSMIMGKLYRTGKGWDFKAIGEAVESKKIDGTIKIIQERFL